MEDRILVLVATEKTRGKHQNEYFGAIVEGEIVIPVISIMHKYKCSHVDCDCERRSMMLGIKSYAGTRMAIVAETDQSEADIKKRIREHCNDIMGFNCEPLRLDRAINNAYIWNRKMAEKYGLGAIVEQRGERYTWRREDEK